MNNTTNEPLEDQKMSRKSSSFYDYEELKREAEALRDVDNAENELKKNLMFEEKDISLFRLYCHLTQKIDIFLLVLAALYQLWPIYLPILWEMLVIPQNIKMIL